MLRGKKILLGVCGSIAAYKTALLIRLLVKEGAHVKVIMTPSAKDFITPLTLSTLSKNPVLTHYFHPGSGEWNSHVELGLWADTLLIAPATANTIAKLAGGICDNLLTAVYLSARCPVYVAPAMDLDMHTHPATRGNLEKIRVYGNKIIDAEYGELASGLTGEGRMAEPEHIMAYLRKEMDIAAPLRGKKALVTAGPTYEAIDPVRFIGNHSSGKMGFAVAEVLASYGAEVELVTGPTQLSTNSPGIRVSAVSSASQMFEVCKEHYQDSDINVFSAAVADYKPKTVAAQKIKKEGNELQLDLEKTVDIAAQLGEMKKPGQFTVGFALETENEQQNAREKLKSKKFDLIVLNSLNDQGAGFGVDTNKITILDAKGGKEEYGLKSKTEIAKDIVNAIVKHVSV